jgi:transcription factor SPT20
MIVQVHDHKTLAPSPETSRAKTGTGKSVPFSIHNYNVYLTPSPYVPYEPNTPSKKVKDMEGEDTKPKSMEQKDKENMPAPSLPNDGQRKQSGTPTKKIYSIVLRPTPLSNYVDLANKAAETRNNMDSRRDSRQDGNGPLSATVPPTPTTAVPSTPLTSMAPPAKRVKKSKLDHSNVYAAESQIILATTAPLVLEPAGSALESAILLEALAHPMHAEKPPSPKTRKRTVAEMAADEAAAAEHERYMLYYDERLSGQARGAQRGSNAADGSGQAGGATFEPRFERFQTLETIKLQHEENKKQEKLRKEEADRKQQQDLARNKLRDETEKKEQEKARMAQMQQQAAQRQAHQEAQRRAQAQQAQQNMQGGIASLQGSHAHPQVNGHTPNVMSAQPQRFHQQQVSQNQTSSPIIRNGTPQSHSSPTVNNMGNVPMQQSTSSMGGSPPRPGSVVHQNHPQMGAPAGHAMNAQRSQQSHAGTPRMPPTPNVQSTPLNRPMSQTPRMSQGSPLQGTVVQTPQMPVMGHQQMPISNAQAAQQQAFQNQRLQMMMRNQQQVAAQQQAAAAAAAQNMGGGMMQSNVQLNAQQQQQLLQAQMMRNQQQLGFAQGQPNYNAQLQQQMAVLAARSGAMPQNMGQNLMGNNPGMANMPMNPAQMQQMQQMQQMRAAQVAQQQQQQQQAAGMHPQGQQMSQQQQIFQRHVMQAANQIYQHQKGLYLQQHPAGIPPEVDVQLKTRAQQAAQQQVQQRFQKQRQEQMMAAQQHQQNMNGMQNGMGM